MGSRRFTDPLNPQFNRTKTHENHTYPSNNVADCGRLALATPGAHAQFAYNNQDVMAEFRQNGSPDLEVNLGQVSFFYSLASTAPGSTVSINNYSAAAVHHGV